MNKIDQMFAYVATDPQDGSEGVIAFLGDDGAWHPMVGADLARAQSLKPSAQKIATATKRVVTLRHFSTMTDMETLLP